MKFVLFTLFLCGFVLEINAGRGFQNLKKPRSFSGLISLVTCEGSVSHIRCVNGSISMLNATFGRTDQTMCSYGKPINMTTNTNCSMRADLVFERCEGELRCPILASTSVFGDPCPGTYKYLEVKYRCRSEFMV